MLHLINICCTFSIMTIENTHEQTHNDNTACTAVTTFTEDRNMLCNSSLCDA